LRLGRMRPRPQAWSLADSSCPRRGPVYAGTNSGVFESTDNGASWTPLNVGLTNPVVEALVRAPGPGGALYAATNGAGVFVLSTELEIELP
jgi:hypothetical protein